MLRTGALPVKLHEHADAPAARLSRLGASELAELRRLLERLI
jgi:hypothetical protein